MNSFKYTIEFFDQIYYRIYRWQLEQWNDKSIAIHSAGANVGFLLCLNVLTVLNILAAALEMPALSFFDAPKVFIGVSIVLWGLMFERFYSRRAELIISLQSSRTDNSKRALHYPSWLYFFCTFIVFLMSCIAVALRLPGNG